MFTQEFYFLFVKGGTAVSPRYGLTTPWKLYILPLQGGGAEPP